MTNPQFPSAPPKGTKGEAATTDRAVGAHQLHLQGGTIGPAVACSECHVVPTTTAHANGKVDLAFGPLATTGGAVPTVERFLLLGLLLPRRLHRRRRDQRPDLDGPPASVLRHLPRPASRVAATPT